MVHGVTGQALKQQNTMKSKQQEKVDKKNALTERYSVMMSAFGVNTGVPSFSALSLLKTLASGMEEGVE